MNSLESPDWRLLARKFHTALRLRPAVWLPLLGLLLYAAVLARYSGACAGGSDSSGYLNNARLLSHARLTMPMRRIPGLDPASLPSYTHVPLGFIPNPDRMNMTPTYPMGLPLLVAATAGIVGWDMAPGLVIGLHALLGLALMYWLGREFGLEAGWAWLGALLLGANSLYLMMSLQLMSDVPATVWLSAAVLCAWKSRTHSQLALAAGIALSIAVLVRPTNLLGVVPVGLALGLARKSCSYRRGDDRSPALDGGYGERSGICGPARMLWTPGSAQACIERTLTPREARCETSGSGLRRWLLLIAGGLPGAVFLGFLNHAAYGSIFTTGYGGIGPMLSTAYVPTTLLQYAHWLPVLLTPLVVLSLGLPLLWRRQPMQTVLLTAWALVLLVFYSFYSVTHEDWWLLRFVLPAFPPLLAASLLVARALAARCRFTIETRWFALATVVILAYAGACFRYFHVSSVRRQEWLYPETAAWMQTHLPANALVASMQTSGALLYYTQFTFFRWDQLSPVDFQRIAGTCAAARIPIYAALFPYEIEEDDWAAFRKHLGSGWTQIGAIRHVTIWRYDPIGVAP